MFTELAFFNFQAFRFFRYGILIIGTVIALKLPLDFYNSKRTIFVSYARRYETRVFALFFKKTF